MQPCSVDPRLRHRIVLIWTVLSVLLLTSVPCAAEPSHEAAHTPSRSGQAASSPPAPEGHEDCSVTDPGPSRPAPAPVRALPYTPGVSTSQTTVRPPADGLFGAAHGPAPSGGRTTLAALCRWLI
ncbi:hypothetical protein AB0H77_21600 [Streptomyces sp. NPDC050844]|uniref:hypothetical protein n=1 Tax=Streptomyces sp. NPDC050844 TaxID=3155790 RepID=UPI0033F2A7B6